MKRIDLVRHLADYGCLLDREGGEHSIFINPANSRKASVPRHREVRDTVARQICKQLQVPDPFKN